MHGRLHYSDLDDSVFARNKEMYLASYHPGATVAQIKENTGWDLKIASNVYETESPAPELIRIFKEECDPTGVFPKKQ